MAIYVLRASSKVRFTFLVIFSFFLIPGILFPVSCTTGQSPIEDQLSPAITQNSQSLLLSTPFIGDETTVRNPAPQPVRVQVAAESVDSWLVPSEKILRFPVDLKVGWKLTFRLGIAAGPYSPVSPQMPIPIIPGVPPGNSQLPPPIPFLPSGNLSPPPSAPNGGPVAVLPAPGDVTLRIEFTSTNSTGEPEGQPSVIYEASADDLAKSAQDWLLVDLPLDEIAPAKGELRFVADGPKAGCPDFQILWGQPALYIPQEESHRNVLLIGIDTLRADAISPLGGRPEITPNIQSFSEGGTVFTKVHSQAPWTLPSFASLVTGVMPSKAIASNMGNSIPENLTTIGELALREGLATCTVCSSPWLGNQGSGFQQGTENFIYLKVQTAQVQIEAAMKFIDRSQQLGRDWFCFVHLMDPHTSYTPPEQLVDQFCDSDYSGEYQYSYPGSKWENEDIRPSQEEIEHERCLYDCEVANVDSAMRDLFDFLDEKGLTEDTLIIFCSDHGEEFNEHGGFEHGNTQYDEQIHVPLIVKGPGFPAGKRIDDCVANLDIMPTILRYLGVAQPESAGGVPLQDTLSGQSNNNRVIFGEEALDKSGLVYSLIWPYKCILDYKTEESQLFDLANDPGETMDLGNEHPEEKAALLAALQMMIRPETSAIHVWVTGYEHSDHRFTGSIQVPGGIEQVQTYLFDPGDTYTVSGDTLEFNISSLINQSLGADSLAPRGVLFVPLPIKHLMITPSPDADKVDISVTVDGEISSNRFFPFGNESVNSSGSASIGLDDFPMVPILPIPQDLRPDSLILWGVRGTESEEPPVELDPETLEQLRALGYLN
jgi:arylsulfatase A-like enzyme